METIPITTQLFFIATVFLTVWLFYKASNNSNRVLLISSAWIILQSILGHLKFYQNYEVVPPRLIFMIGPPLLFIIYLIVYKRDSIIQNFNFKYLTLIHIVRIPVEICLLQLYLHKLIPQSMTFEGINFDIVSGISAIGIYFFAFKNGVTNKTLLWIWNIICLALVINVVSIGILSAKTPFQQLAFEQANIGVTLFPFNLLPAFIVPVVIFSHLISFLQLRKMSN